MSKNYLFSLCLCVALAFQSCTKDDKDESPRELVTAGIYVLNEGFMESDNSSLSFHNLETGTTDIDFYRTVNGSKLGETAHDLKSYGSKLYCVITGTKGNKNSYLEVMNVYTGKTIKRIPFFDDKESYMPRGLVFYKNKAYVGGYDGKLSVVGFIVLGFDHTVMDRQDKEEILIKGNANSLFAEPGVVWVMQDVNGNGLPDDVWYELAGSAAGKDGYIRNYSVTYTKPATPGEDVSWKDNQGKEGVIKKDSAHKQSYFPEWISGNSYTLTGTLLPSSNIDASKPSFITSKPFDWGYADNLVAGDKLDIAHAIDAKGNKAVLKGIDFIKIQTGLLHDMGWLGEQSTELTLVADLELFEKQK